MVRLGVVIKSLQNRLGKPKMRKSKGSQMGTSRGQMTQRIHSRTGRDHRLGSEWKCGPRRTQLQNHEFRPRSSDVVYVYVVQSELALGIVHDYVCDGWET